MSALYLQSGCLYCNFSQDVCTVTLVSMSALYLQSVCLYCNFDQCVCCVCTVTLVSMSVLYLYSSWWRHWFCLVPRQKWRRLFLTGSLATSALKEIQQQILLLRMPLMATSLMNSSPSLTWNLGWTIISWNSSRRSGINALTINYIKSGQN